MVSFLDKEQRPKAEIVTESFVGFGTSKKGSIDVKGVLGAIKSDRKPGSFVAFSGVEVGVSQFTAEAAGNGLRFTLDGLSCVQTLTVQMVLKSQAVYAVDLNLKGFGGSGGLELPLSSFKKSFRGKIGESKFTQPIETVKSVRFFLKRSENSALSKEPLHFRFTLSKLKIAPDF